MCDEIKLASLILKQSTMIENLLTNILEYCGICQIMV